MKSQRYEGEELDAASLDYLRTVRDHHGHGVPGVYLDSKVADLTAANLPGCGAVIGAVLMVLALILMWSFILGDPFNLAMLITGIGFLGAWLVVAWIRCLIARGRADHVGYFKYFDPVHLWHGTGGGVVVTPLRGLQEARCTHQYSNEGGYSGSNVCIVFEEGKLDVKVKSEPLAEALETYVNEVARDRGGLPLDRGYAAAARALSEDGDFDPNEEKLVEGIPEPHKARTSFGWLIRYPLVIALFALTFYGVYQLCSFWHDEAFFAAATGKPQKELSDLRGYLAEPSRTAHRATVLAILKRHHDNVAGSLEASPGEDDLKKGLAEIIRHLGDSHTPVVSFGFVRTGEVKENTMDGILGPGTASTTITTQLTKMIGSLINKLGTLPADPSLKGPIMEYVGVEDRPAMITLDPQLKRNDPDGKHVLTWVMTLQAGEGEEAQKKAKVVRWKKEFTAREPAEFERAYSAAWVEFSNHFAEALNGPIPANLKP